MYAKTWVNLKTLDNVKDDSHELSDSTGFCVRGTPRNQKSVERDSITDYLE